MHFNAEFNALSYDAAILRIPLRQHDEELHRMLTRRLLELEQSHPEDFVSRVEHVIRQMLPAGRCSVELTAKCLNLGKRTLQSRLKDERVTFQQLLERIRSDIASSYLQESVVTMTTLAELLGYSELSAFSRAFKRWFGVAPLSWKVGTECLRATRIGDRQ